MAVHGEPPVLWAGTRIILLNGNLSHAYALSVKGEPALASNINVWKGSNISEGVVRRCDGRRQRRGAPRTPFWRMALLGTDQTMAFRGSLKQFSLGTGAENTERPIRLSRTGLSA